MKKTLIILLLFVSSSSYADPAAYFKIGEEKNPIRYSCSIHLERGETFAGIVNMPADSVAYDALRKVITKKTTRSLEVYLEEVISPKDSSREFFEIQFDVATKRVVKKTKLLDASYCELIVD